MSNAPNNLADRTDIEIALETAQDIEDEPSRFESKPFDFVSIAGPTLVYIGVAKREDFDKLALPCMDNGQTNSGHVLTKTVNSFGANEVTVVFQHWIKQLTIEAMCADVLVAHAAKESKS